MSLREPVDTHRRVRAPGQSRARIGLPSGVQVGDVTTSEAVLWARADGNGTLVARLADGRGVRTLRGPAVGRSSDYTARLDVAGLAPDRGYSATLWFEGADGSHGEAQTLTFRTAARRAQRTSFVWTGDTCGHGWGINPELGGLLGYAAMRELEPDLLVHCGQAVSPTEPIADVVVEPDGGIWRNLVTSEVAKVAETLEEWRGRYRYNLLDEHLRAFAAAVPVVAHWDDHETHLGWSPGQILADGEYQERRVDVLAARARRAWQEYQPVSTASQQGRGRDGFAGARLFRRVERGAGLDLFCLDMRISESARADGTAQAGMTGLRLLGDAQVDWLVREVVRSTATWKVIVADTPLALVTGGTAGDELLTVLRAFRDAGVRNVLWVTSDVHYAAAHHYRPEGALFTEFDPFWELVAGPINGGTQTARRLDGTLGPEVVFGRYADRPGESPRSGRQFFGYAEIDPAGVLTVQLRDVAGTVLWSHELVPR